MRSLKKNFGYITPTFFTGLASIFNIGGNYYSFRFDEPSIEASFNVIGADFEKVGQDLKSAMDQYENNPKQLKLDLNG